jgi:hypothetical protein
MLDVHAVELEEDPVDDIWKHPEEDEDPSARGAMIRQLAKEFREEKDRQERRYQEDSKLWDKRHEDNFRTASENARKLDRLGDQLGIVSTDVIEVKVEAKRTNGRVTSLEWWKAMTLGAISVLMAIIVPVLLLVIGAWVYKTIGGK